MHISYGAFRCHHHYLVVLIPEGGSDAPGVAHAQHLAAARHAAKHVAAVPHGGGELEHVGQVDVVFDVARDVCIGEDGSFTINALCNGGIIKV